MNDEQRPSPLHIFGAANPEQNEQLARDAQAIVDADVAALPKDCSGTPSSCPDNEGHGCACSPVAAPQVVTDERQAFESWIGLNEKMGPQAERYENTYTDNYVGEMWESWQARAALAAAPVQAQEPVGEIACVWLRHGEAVVKLRDHSSVTAGQAIYTAPVQPVAVPDGWTAESARELFRNAQQKPHKCGAWEDLEVWQREIYEKVAQSLNSIGQAAPAAQGDAKDASLLDVLQKAIGWCEDPGFRTDHTAKQMQTLLDGMRKEFLAAIAAKAAS